MDGFFVVSRLKQFTEKLIAHFARRCFDALPKCGSFRAHIGAFEMKRKVVHASQFGNQLLVLIGFVATQLVIEMNNRENDSEFGAEFKEDTKKPHGIRSAGDCQAKAVSGFHHVQLPDLLEDLLGQSVHENMVQPGDSFQLPGPF